MWYSRQELPSTHIMCLEIGNPWEIVFIFLKIENSRARARIREPDAENARIKNDEYQKQHFPIKELTESRQNKVRPISSKDVIIQHYFHRRYPK